MKPGERKSVVLRLAPSHSWYDFTVRVAGSETFARRFQVADQEARRRVGLLHRFARRFEDEEPANVARGRYRDAARPLAQVGHLLRRREQGREPLVALRRPLRRDEDATRVDAGGGARIARGARRLVRRRGRHAAKRHERAPDGEPFMVFGTLGGDGQD